MQRIAHLGGFVVLSLVLMGIGPAPSALAIALETSPGVEATTQGLADALPLAGSADRGFWRLILVEQTVLQSEQTGAVLPALDLTAALPADLGVSVEHEREAQRVREALRFPGGPDAFLHTGMMDILRVAFSGSLIHSMGVLRLMRREMVPMALRSQLVPVPGTSMEVPIPGPVDVLMVLGVLVFPLIGHFRPRHRPHWTVEPRMVASPAEPM